VVVLERHHPGLALPVCRDALGCGEGGGQGSDIWDLVLYRRLPYVGVVAVARFSREKRANARMAKIEKCLVNSGSAPPRPLAPAWGLRASHKAGVPLKRQFCNYLRGIKKNYRRLDF